MSIVPKTKALDLFMIPMDIALMWATPPAMGLLTLVMTVGKLW